MALYESLTKESTPDQIAAAYAEAAGAAGGDTAANQQIAGIAEKGRPLDDAGSSVRVDRALTEIFG